MRNIRSGVFIFCLCVVCSTTASALSVNLYVDSSPPWHGGTPAYDAWWDATRASILGGSFQSMQNGMFPGSTTIAPEDAISYRTGDRGRRLRWIYWIPDATVGDLLNGYALETKIVFDWGLLEYALHHQYDTFPSSILNLPDQGWAQPMTGWLEDYDEGTYQGVFGEFRWVLWTREDLALPDGVTPNPYDEVGPEDIDAMYCAMLSNMNHVTGMIRWQESGEWQEASLQTTMIPEPATLMLFGLGLCGMGAYVNRKRRK